jgi:hypothetical protein
MRLVSSPVVTHGALDPFEMRLVSSPVVTHGALDPFETRVVALPVVGASSDFIDEGPAYPRPEFR